MAINALFIIRFTVQLTPIATLKSFGSFVDFKIKSGFFNAFMALINESLPAP